MSLIHKKGGFTIVEGLIVMGVMGILIAVAGTMVSKYMVSRSFDNAMKGMSSTLQMAKMKAARHGVEHRVVFARCTNIDDTTNPDCPVCNTYVDFAPGDDTMTMSIERGNSNRASDKWCIESTITKKMHSHMDVDMTAITENDPYRCGFNPNGFVVDEAGAPIPGPIPMLITPNSNAKVKRCGKIEVKPIGGVSVLQGNWDGTTCNPIREPVSP